MKKWFTVNRLFYLNFCVYLLALTLFLLGTCLPYWLIKGDDFRWGIFENCTKHVEGNDTITKDWHCKFVGIMENQSRFRVIIFLLYCSLAAGVFTGVTMLARYLPLCCVCEMYAAFFILTAVYNFSSEIWPGEQLDWAFYIATMSGVAYAMNGIGLIALMKTFGRKLDQSPCSKDDTKLKEHEAFYKLYLTSADNLGVANEIEA